MSSCVNVKHRILDGQKIIIPSKSILIIVPVTEVTNNQEYTIIKKILSNNCTQVILIDELEYELRVEGISFDAIKQQNLQEIQKLLNWKRNLFILVYDNTLNRRTTTETRSHQSDPYLNKITPDRRAEWVLTLIEPVNVSDWKIQTKIKITATKFGEFSFNPYGDAYYIGLKKSMTNLRKKAIEKCN